MKKAKRLNGKLTTSPKSKCCKATNSTETAAKIEFYPCDLVVLNSLKIDELKYYNLLNNELDEAKIAQRAKILFSNEPYNKSKYLFIEFVVLILIILMIFNRFENPMA